MDEILLWDTNNPEVRVAYALNLIVMGYLVVSERDRNSHSRKRPPYVILADPTNGRYARFVITSADITDTSVRFFGPDLPRDGTIYERDLVEPAVLDILYIFGKLFADTLKPLEGLCEKEGTESKHVRKCETLVKDVLSKERSSILQRTTSRISKRKAGVKLDWDSYLQDPNRYSD